MSGPARATAGMPSGNAGLDLHRLFNPRAIALVGASSDPQRIGGQPLRILRASGYAGAVYPVNPRHARIDDLACFPDVRSVPHPCDVALIAVKAALVSQVLADCGAAGIPFAVVLSAGFRETGEAGATLEQELKAAAREAGVRVVGPNCIGFMNLVDRVYCGFGAGFMNPRLKSGPLAFVSQSGGFAFSVVGLADYEGIGFNYIVSAGNEADISILDLIADFLEREEVQAVAAYVEGIADGRRLRGIGRRGLELGKPILIWKVGNSEIGRAAAESHTASMTASYTLYRAAFEEGGFIEIGDVHDLVDAARAFLGRKLPRGPNVAVLTTSGGSGVLIADACDRHGLALPKLDPKTVAAIEPLAPKYASFANPVDLTAQATGDHERVGRVCERMLADPNVDQLIIRYGAVQGAAGAAWSGNLVKIAAATAKPVLVAWSRAPDPDEPARKTLEAHGVPWLLTPTRAAFAAGALWQFARKRAAGLARCRRGLKRPLKKRALRFASRPRRLSEHRSKLCLARYGIPVVREATFSLREIERARKPPLLPFPVAVKVDSSDIPHKTEAGAVRLDVASLGALKRAAREVVRGALAFVPGARVNGVLVSEMARGTEVIVGAVNDRYFGPVVMFGLGGVFVEALGDVAYRFAPFDTETAREMIGELRAAPLLTGHRGRPPLALEALAETLSRVSWLAHDHADRIAEIDINPLIVSERGVVVADALIVLRN